MSILKTKIIWNLHDYCTAGCTYCPGNLSGGTTPPEIFKYIEVANRLIDHYASLGRKVDWIFNGGEPLEMFDFPEFLKVCKTEESSIVLASNGGKLWMDWWAIEPYISHLSLTYHYWQNPNLIRFIIQLFNKKGKSIDIKVPIRHDYFKEDMARAKAIEEEYGFYGVKQSLYILANTSAGFMNYSKDDLVTLIGQPYADQNEEYKTVTFSKRSEEINNGGPVFSGMKCMGGIETLHIGHTGWVSASQCNNISLGNIWHGLNLPAGPQICGMQSCIHPEDHSLTKY